MDYIIVTINNLVISSPRYRLQQKVSIEPNLNADIDLKLNFDNGYISILLIPYMENGAPIGSNGAFLLSRACIDTNYTKWDNENKERLKIQEELIEIFADELDILIGGQISIDIIPKGMDKAQILNHLDGPITFFGDKVKSNENDRSIVDALLDRNDPCRIVKVSNWKDTRSYISDLFHKQIYIK